MKGHAGVARICAFFPHTKDPIADADKFNRMLDSARTGWRECVAVDALVLIVVKARNSLFSTLTSKAIVHIMSHSSHDSALR